VPEAHSIRNSDISREYANAFGVGNPHSGLVNCQGEDSNSRPTPKAFGAALRAFLGSELLQIMNGKPWILFRLHHSLDAPRFIERFDLFACYKLETFTQPSRCVSMSTSMLRQSGI
jgi:hypothetical protein